MEKVFWKVALIFLFAASLFGGAAESSERAAEHSVARGESLWKIAKNYGTTVSVLQKANEKRYPGIVTDPDRILAGWTLAIPSRMDTAAQTANMRGAARAEDGAAPESRALPPVEAQPVRYRAASGRFAWTKADRNRCRLSFEDALKKMGDSDELIALFHQKREAKDYQWTRLAEGEVYDAMCFGKRIARNVTNALPQDMPEWAYWAREYVVEKDGVRHRRRDPLVCGNILKLPDERLVPPVPPKEPGPSPKPPKTEPPEKSGTPEAAKTCECGELFEVIAAIGPLPQRSHNNDSERSLAEIYHGP